jgi:hypothetical protein
MSFLDLFPFFAAALVPMLVGAFWYHPRVFGTTWMDLKHITPDMANSAARRSISSAFLLFVGSLCCALVLGYILGALAVSTYVDSMFVAISIWLAFIVPPTLGRLVWDHVSYKLYAIETGQWLVSLIIMSFLLVY